MIYGRRDLLPPSSPTPSTKKLENWLSVALRRTNRQIYFTLDAGCVIVPDLRECHSPYLSNERDGFGVEPTLTGGDDQRDKKGEPCEWGSMYGYHS